jgi:hypothetical protein
MIMPKITLEFEDSDLMFAASEYQRANDELDANAMTADAQYSTDLFVAVEDARLELAEMLFDAYANRIGLRNSHK